MISQKGKELWKKAKKLIPGGTQLLSKRSEQFLPENWPSYFSRAKGVEIWDLDGNKFIDMSLMGVGACTLGYADDDVDNAVKDVIDKGSMATLNSPEEVELAEILLKIHPWAEMVRYARTGGEAMAVAVRIARAYAKKEKVAFCGYHGWHDWYLSSNLAKDDNLSGHLLPGLEPLGVPKNLIETAIPFEYNNIESLKSIVKEHEIGVIILEPFRHTEPANNFLQEVRKIANQTGAVLVFDEISCGWRNNVGGIHLLYKVNPDIAVFAKAISNGFPMAAIIGKGKIMDTAQSSFISSTYWTERVGPAAAIATIRKMQRENVPEHLNKIGKMIGEGWKNLAEKHNLKIKILGPNPLITFSFEKDDDLKLKTLFTQEMLKRGFLASLSVYVSYAHKEKHVKDYLKSVDEVFSIIKGAITNNNADKLLEGPAAHKGFRRLVW
jgi:glutamate-1-semialdehyde aminotransferase